MADVHGVLQKDDNGYPVMGGVSSANATLVKNSVIDSVTGRLRTDNSGVISGITSINTDTTAAQLLVVGTSGTDFAIADNGTGTHTFNLPTASHTNRGALSSADWDTFNAKGSGSVTTTGSPASGNLTKFSGTTSVTNGDLSGDITTSGTLATTLATVNANVGTFGSATQASVVTVNGKGLVTAASNTTVTPAVGSITGLGTGVATFLATPSSANLAAALTDETGSGAAVFANTPTLVTPVLGAATATSITSSGANQLSAGSTTLYVVPTSAGATGPTTAAFNSGYTSTAVGDLVYLDSSTTWQKADNSTSTATKAGLLAIALTVTASGAAATVALPGSFVFATAWNLATVGAPVYMGTAAGITLTAPTTTDTATRIVGWVTASGNGTTKIWFQPSPDYITHT